MNIKRETLHKSEKLCSTKIISGLFENGNIFHNSLFKVVWETSPVELTLPVQIAFSVSKRGFRLAVTRNLLKRRMREVYRKNKRLLYDHLSSENIQIVLVIILKGNTVADFSTIEKSMNDVLRKLIILTGKKEKIC